jgi:prepilin-type N-terminal cleavage/methylation domain-containing protein
VSRSAGGDRLSRARRAGFSLVELIVSMTLLAIVLSSLVMLNYSVAERGSNNDLITKRNFALQHEANRFGAMSFDALGTTATGTTTIILGDLAFLRTLTITNSGFNRRTVKIVIAPLRDETRRDSVVFARTRPPTGTPLCANC